MRHSNELETAALSVSSDKNLGQSLEMTSLLKIVQSGSKALLTAFQTKFASRAA